MILFVMAGKCYDVATKLVLNGQSWTSPESGSPSEEIQNRKKASQHFLEWTGWFETK